MKSFKLNKVFRNLVLFSTFQGVGSGIFGIFMMWAIHATFQNPIYTGMAGFMFAAPRIASFIVGPLVDRWNKPMLLKATSLLQFSAIAAILFTSIFLYPNIWIFLAAIFINAIAELFEKPTFKALLPKIIEEDDLVKANVFIELVGIVAGVIVGAGILAMMIADVAFGWIYGVNAVFMLIALLCAFLLKSDEAENKSSTNIKTYLGELKEGFSFVLKGAMLPLLISAISVSFFANIASVNLPMFAEVHFGAAFGFILLSGLAVVGSLLGTLLFGAVGEKFKLGKILALLFVFAGMVRIAFVGAIGVHLILGILIFILYEGVTDTIGMFYYTATQKLPQKNLIGRVSTSFTSLRATSNATGSLAGGVLGVLLANVDMAFVIQGASYIAIGLFLLLSKRIRGLPKVSEFKSE